MAIDSLEAIRAGGTTQWIRIRGADASNPVLLLIQQGPGLPMINEARRFEHLLGLEQDFTVIYWDQRGCGRSLRRREDRTGVNMDPMLPLPAPVQGVRLASSPSPCRSTSARRATSRRWRN